MSDRIRLNVGGARFETTLTTLRRFPDSMLATMFLGRDRIDVPLDPDGFAFVDRNAECFAAVLEYYRTGELDWPTDGARRRALARELDYYALEPPVDVPKCTFNPAEIRRMLSISTALELSAADFSGFDFSHLTLDKARFKHAVLSRAVFRGSKLCETTLCHADLTGADLRDANLALADLSHADLRHADLRGAYLAGAVLSGADLRGSQLDARTMMAHCNLDGANLSGLDLSAFKYFGSCSIDDADFSNANLRGVKIDKYRHYCARHDVLTGQPRENAERKLRGCIFAGANLEGAQIQGLRHQLPGAVTFAL